MLGYSLRYDDGKVIGSKKCIKLGIYDGKVLVLILGNIDGIRVGIDVGTEKGSLDGYFKSSNDGKLEGLLILDSLGFDDGKVLGSYE